MWLTFRGQQYSNDVSFLKGGRGMVVASPPISCQHEKFAKPSQGWPHLGLKERVSFSKDCVCRACVDGKMHDSPHKAKTIISSKRILELLHVNLFGAVPKASLGGKRYCLVIIDDFSRYTWVYFFKCKSETQQAVIDFSTQVQRQHNLPILVIRSDNGSEF